MKAYKQFKFLACRNFLMFSSSIEKFPFLSSFERGSLPKIMDILKIATSHKHSMKDEQTLPFDLKTYFQSYQQFLEWQMSIGLIFERQKNIAGIYELDIMVWIKFLTQFKKLNNKPLPDEIYDSLSTIMRGRQRTLIHSIQGLRLSIRQTRLNKIEKKELLSYCINLPTQQFNSNSTTLFHVCLNQIAQKVLQNRNGIRLEEATVVLQALKEQNILSELIKFNPLWLRYLVTICMKSIENNDDLRNLSTICNVMTDTGDQIILILSQAITKSLQSSDITPPTSLDIVTMLGMLSHVVAKTDERFLQALKVILQPKYQLQVLKSPKVADQVISFWSLSKISSENQSLKLTTESMMLQLFQSLKGKIIKSKSVENSSQFYVASIRQGLLTEMEAKNMFKIIINNPEINTKMFGIVLYDTFLRFPEIISQDSSLIIPKLPHIVNHYNIANIYAALRNQPEAQEQLFSKALTLLPLMHFDGIRIIMDVIRSQNNPERQTQFLRQLLTTMSQTLEHPIEATSKFMGQEQNIAALFLSMKADLVKLEQLEEIKNLPVSCILKSLKFYQDKSDIRIRKNGLGNILQVCSSLKESKNEHHIHAINSFYLWVLQHIEEFDLLELLNFFKAINELNLNSEEVTNKIDDYFVNKLVDSERGNEKQNSVRQRFLVSFSRYYKPQYQSLIKAYDYIGQLEKQVEQSEK